MTPIISRCTEEMAAKVRSLPVKHIGRTNEKERLIGEWETDT